MAKRPSTGAETADDAAMLVVPPDEWKPGRDAIPEDPRWIVNWTLLSSALVSSLADAGTAARIETIEKQGTSLGTAAVTAHRGGEADLLAFAKDLAGLAVAYWRVN